MTPFRPLTCLAFSFSLSAALWFFVFRILQWARFVLSTIFPGL